MQNNFFRLRTLFLIIYFLFSSMSFWGCIMYKGNDSWEVEKTKGKQKEITYTIKLTQPDKGSITSAPFVARNGTEIESGKEIVFTAHPDSGYKVSSWGGAIQSGSPNRAKLTVTQDTTVTVALEKIQYYTIALTQPSHGSISSTPNISASGTEIEAGKEIVFTAHPDSGYKVASWGGGAIQSSSPNTAKLVVSKNTNVAVIFEKIITHTITLAQPVNGTITASPSIASSGTEIEAGKEVVFTAHPNSGYRVAHWTGAIQSGSPNTAKLTVAQDTKVTAAFEKIVPKYTVTLISPEIGIEGSITATPSIPPDGKVAAGTTINFTVSPKQDYSVDSWIGATVDSADSKKATLTVNKDVTVSVNLLLEGCVGVDPPQEDFMDSSTPVGGSENPAPGSGEEWKGVFCNGRQVKLTPYILGETEVTYELWREVYNWAIGNGYFFANAGKAGSKGQEGSPNVELPQSLSYSNHPVTKVSWRDCVVWCNAYSQKVLGEEHCVYRVGSATGAVIRDARSTNSDQVDSAFAAMSKKGFRLPTEAEWEFAARYEKGESGNSDGTAVAYGEGIWLTKLTYASGAKDAYTNGSETREVGWFNKAWSSNAAHEVGQKRQNAMGLYDMSGNVAEWCFDRYGLITPGSFIDPQGPATGISRVLRGGSWESPTQAASLGLRKDYTPGISQATLGFRVAQTK